MAISPPPPGGKGKKLSDFINFLLFMQKNVEEKD